MRYVLLAFWILLSLFLLQFLAFYVFHCHMQAPCAR